MQGLIYNDTLIVRVLRDTRRRPSSRAEGELVQVVTNTETLGGHLEGSVQVLGVQSEIVMSGQHSTLLDKLLVLVTASQQEKVLDQLELVQKVRVLFGDFVKVFRDVFLHVPNHLMELGQVQLLRLGEETAKVGEETDLKVTPEGGWKGESEGLDW